MHKITHKDVVDIIEKAGRSQSQQVFSITRAPESAPLTARDLHKLLYFARTDTEWGVMEITPMEAI